MCLIYKRYDLMQKSTFLRKCVPMNDSDLATHLRECIQKVATGPEYSKDLSEDEAYKAMRALLLE